MCTAVVARNHLDQVVQIHMTRLDFSNALCGEAATYCLAVSLAMNLRTGNNVAHNMVKVGFYPPIVLLYSDLLFTEESIL
uniref:Uncharacterized protein n=1 Tax=Cannabis sativa TaxID=3483 RepID=A0A803NFE1_CANSA